MKRRLTDTEKKKIRSERMLAALAEHPKAKIEVYVQDETDDHGNPVVRVIWQE